MSLFRLCLPLVLSSFLVFVTQAQEMSRPIISYDFALQQFDTLEAVAYDVNVKSAKTTFSFGEMDPQSLPQDLPLENLIEGTNFSKPASLSEGKSMTSFPISTTIKLFKVTGDSYRDQCTGVMVSDRHVLTSAHCVLEPYKTNIHAKQLVATAGYNVDMPTAEHISSKVMKMYFIDEWNIGNGDDQALLELAEPIGDYTGWISMGFNDNDDFFLDKPFQKLSYPTYRTPFNDYPFNGDTLYHAYGPIDYVHENFIGVVGHLKGAGGESGSSFIYTNNKDEFTSYGVLTWLGNYNHSRFTSERYHAFEQILAPHVYQMADNAGDDNIMIYPNPTSGFLDMKLLSNENSYDNLEIYNNMGIRLYSNAVYANRLQLDLSSYPDGQYYIRLSSKEGKSISKTIVKAR